MGCLGLFVFTDIKDVPLMSPRVDVLTFNALVSTIGRDTTVCNEARVLAESFEFRSYPL